MSQATKAGFGGGLCVDYVRMRIAEDSLNLQVTDWCLWY